MGITIIRGIFRTKRIGFVLLWFVCVRVRVVCVRVRVVWCEGVQLCVQDRGLTRGGTRAAHFVDNGRTTVH